MSGNPEIPSIRSRFPAPWRAEKTPRGYRIEAMNGKNVAYVYEEVEPVRRALVNHVTSGDCHEENEHCIEWRV